MGIAGRAGSCLHPFVWGEGAAGGWWAVTGAIQRPQSTPRVPKPGEGLLLSAWRMVVLRNDG